MALCRGSEGRFLRPPGPRRLSGSGDAAASHVRVALLDERRQRVLTDDPGAVVVTDDAALQAAAQDVAELLRLTRRPVRDLACLVLEPVERGEHFARRPLGGFRPRVGVDVRVVFAVLAIHARGVRVDQHLPVHRFSAGGELAHVAHVSAAANPVVRGGLGRRVGDEVPLTRDSGGRVDRGPDQDVEMFGGQHDCAHGVISLISLIVFLPGRHAVPIRTRSGAATRRAAGERISARGKRACERGSKISAELAARSAACAQWSVRTIAAGFQVKERAPQA
ncbi:hypothetical protein ACFPRL_36440 [Pseudoclavibacter helvolus]